MTDHAHQIRQASTALILDTRTKKKDGTYPVKLRITFDRKQKYYPTGRDFSQEEFEKVFGEKPRKENKENRLYLESIEQKAKAIIKDMPAFSFEGFEKRFLAKKADERSVYAAYQKSIERLSRQGRAGNADSLDCSMSSIKKFHKKPTLTFDQVTVEFLNAYEKWMSGQGKSLTTIGIYLRALRTLYNEAIENGIVKVDAYPFGKRRYQIPSGRNVKKALTLAEIGKIFHYEADTSSREAWSKDIWVFSYLCSGINIKDIARLRYKDITGDKIHFIRSKTERTTRQALKPITVHLTDEAKAVIDRWGVKTSSPTAYVFDILPAEAITPERELALVRQASKTINKYIGRIAQAVGIDKKVTSYFARHSFATVLKQSGASIEFISESLGHSDLRTTESYLDSFTDEVKKEYTKSLTNF